MSRILAVSNIHGYYEEFVKLMKVTGYQKGQDKLYILGDFVDMGPDVLKTITLLRNLQTQYPDTVKIIRGEHDNEFIKTLKMILAGETYDEQSWGLYDEFSGNGIYNLSIIDNTFDFVSKEKLITWFESLPLYIEDGPYIFVHAGISSNLPMDKQNEQILLWGRANEKDDPFFLRKAYQNKVVIFGHTATRVIHTRTSSDNAINHSIWFDCKNYDKIGIDCCVWAGGKLGALEICPETDQYKEYYV